MATVVYKWRVWCNDDNDWAYVWNPETPTVCPENSKHIIDTDKTSIIETISSDFPVSDVGTKIAVHSSPKPIVPGKATYGYFTSAGDDVIKHIIGDGQPCSVTTTIDQPTTDVDIKFDPLFGKVFISDGLLIWKNAGDGDSFSVKVVAEPTKLQMMANLNFVIEDNKVKPTAPGKGTHGFAATPVLVPSPTNVGWWDYNTSSGLAFNGKQTGAYDIWDIEKVVHRFLNKFLIFGTNNTYISIDSADTSEMPAGYFMRITAHNNSNTVWTINLVLEMFRERTI